MGRVVGCGRVCRGGCVGEGVRGRVCICMCKEEGVQVHE